MYIAREHLKEKEKRKSEQRTPEWTQITSLAQFSLCKTGPWCSNIKSQDNLSLVYCLSLNC